MYTMSSPPDIDAMEPVLRLTPLDDKAANCCNSRVVEKSKWQLLLVKHYTNTLYNKTLHFNTLYN